MSMAYNGFPCVYASVIVTYWMCVWVCVSESLSLLAKVPKRDNRNIMKQREKGGMEEKKQKRIKAEIE